MIILKVSSEIRNILLEKNMAIDEIESFIFIINESYNDKEKEDILEEIKSENFDYKKLRKKVFEKHSMIFEKEREENAKYVKENCERDSKEYIDFVIEKYSGRDLITNTIVYHILQNKYYGIKFVDWIEKNDKEVTVEEIIKKCLEIVLNDSDYKYREFDEKDLKLIELIKENDQSQLLTLEEIKFIVSLTNKFDYTRDYLFDKLSQEDYKTKPFIGNLKHYFMDLIANPSYMKYSDDETYEKAQEQKKEEAKKALIELLKKLEKEGVISNDTVQKALNFLQAYNKYYLLYEFLLKHENDNEKLTESEILDEIVRIYKDLTYKNNQIFRKLGINIDLDDDGDKIRLSRYINKNINKLFLGKEYDYINCQFNNIQMNQVIERKSHLYGLETIDQTIFNITTPYTIDIHFQTDMKIGQYAYCTPKEIEEDYDLYIPFHILNDEVVDNCIKGEKVNVQISSICFDLIKVIDESKTKIFYTDCIPKLNTLVSSDCSRIFRFNEDLALFRAKLLEKRIIGFEVFDEVTPGYELIINTQFGIIPIYTSLDKGKKIEIGDIVEGALYLSADPIHYFSDVKFDRTIENNYELLRYAYERHNFRILKDIINDDIEYISSNLQLKGKTEVINTLQEIADSEDDIPYKIKKCMIIADNEDKNILKGDIGLACEFREEKSITHVIKIWLDDTGLINKILLCNDGSIDGRCIDAYPKKDKALTKYKLKEKISSFLKNDEKLTSNEDYIDYYNKYFNFINELEKDIYEIHRHDIEYSIELSDKQEDNLKHIFEEEYNETDYKAYKKALIEIVSFIDSSNSSNEYLKTSETSKLSKVIIHLNIKVLNSLKNLEEQKKKEN